MSDNPNVSTELKEIVEKFAKTQHDFLEISDSHSKEIKDLGDSSAETKESLEKAATALLAVEEEIKSFQDRVDEVEKNMKQPQFSTPERLKSFGETIVESDQYKNNDGKSMKSVNFKTFFPRKDVSTVPADDGYTVQPMRVPELYYDPGQRPMAIRDVINTGTTQSNAVEFIRETLFTNNAEAVEEKPEYGKPMSDFEFELFNSPVSTIAHWVPATRQCLADVPIMLSYVSGRLVYGLEVAEDNDILFGTGLGGVMTGIMVTAGVPTQVGAVVPATDTTIDSVRRAINVVRQSEYPADTIIMNPANWTIMELTKEVGTLAYIWANPANALPPRLWGLRVVESTAMPIGRFLVGSFRLGCQLWDREQASVRVSEHHEDYFTNNMVAILAEERLALTVYRPQAFVAGTF